MRDVAALYNARGARCNCPAKIRGIYPLLRASLVDTGLQGRASAAKLPAARSIMGVLQPMDEEDLQPQARKPDLKKLDVMSVEALEDYIVELEAEISRVRAEIAKKQSAKSAAESVFRK